MRLMRTTAMLDPNAPELVSGSPEDQKQAREEAKRRQRLGVVQRANLPELRRAELETHRLGLLHTPTGDLYVIERGELHDASHTTAAAYYVTGAEDVQLLKRPDGPQSLDELAAKRAERDARRNEPKPRR